MKPSDIDDHEGGPRFHEMSNEELARWKKQRAAEVQKDFNQLNKDVKQSPYGKKDK